MPLLVFLWLLLSIPIHDQVQNFKLDIFFIPKNYWNFSQQFAAVVGCYGRHDNNVGFLFFGCRHSFVTSISHSLLIPGLTYSLNSIGESNVILGFSLRCFSLTLNDNDPIVPWPTNQPTNHLSNQHLCKINFLEINIYHLILGQGG